MDPISDMLIRIKNAAAAGHTSASMPHSRMKQEIARALERAGFVGKAERKGKRVKKTLEVALAGGRRGVVLSGVHLLSTPGRRRYVSHRELRPAPRGGVIILTTSKGVLTGSEARKQKVGGQLIAEVW